MTREEADRLQEYIDAYVELRDAKPEGGDADPEFREMKFPGGGTKKIRVPPRAHRVRLMKMNLAMTLAPLIPEIKVGGADLTMLLGPLAKLFAPKLETDPKPMLVSVVDGHEEIDIEDLSEEEQEQFWKDYGISVPSDLAIEAANMKSTQKLATMAYEKAVKDGKL